MPRPRSLHAVAILVLCAAACTCNPPPPDVHRRHLITLPETYRKKSIFVSDDGDDAVYAITSPDGDQVVHDGQAGPLLKEIGPPRMAPGTRRVFYWALDLLDGKRAIFLYDGVTRLVTGFERPGELLFSKNGKRWATVGAIDVQQDGAEATRGPVGLFVDGTQAGSFPDASQPAFSRDARHLAYLVQQAGGSVALLVNGQQRRRFPPPPPGASPPVQMEEVGPTLSQHYDVRFLSDNSLLTVATDAEGWAVFHDDTRLASYAVNVVNNRRGGIAVQFGGQLEDAPAFVPSTLVAAEVVPIAAWWMREPGKGERWHVARNGVPEPVPCARYGDAPVMSADGRHLAYACNRTPEGQPDRVEVIFDGRRFGPYTNVWGIALSPSGTRIAFGADGGAPDRPWFYVVDGKRYGLTFDRVFPPRFSPDGRHIAWVAERHGRLILFLDGHGYASSDDLIWAPTFGLGKGLSWAVLRGRRVSRVDIGPLR